MIRNISVAAILGLALVLSAYLLGDAFKKRNYPQKKITVKGLGQTDFTSDLIVWQGNFYTEHTDLKQAYAQLQKQRKTIEKYLQQKGIKAEEIIFNAAQATKLTKPVYNDQGRYLYDTFAGYRIEQNFKIKSKEVAKVEKISREITDLLNLGITLYSSAPRYYYTKLPELKLDLISKATKNARVRAEKIADNAGAHLGKLVSAKMGVFQITGQYSDEDYSWGGTFNTTSKDKTASITMQLVYEVEK